MKIRLLLIILGMSVMLLLSGILAAQEPVVASSDPESLFTSKDPKLHTQQTGCNAYHARHLLEAGHWDEAPKWLTERYIQHNPAFASGR